MEPDYKSLYEQLRKDLDALSQEVYSNNFSAHQDFNKSSFFTTRLKVPHYDILPTTCETGEIVEKGGKLYVASALNTWTVVGTQS
jgi:hypothetical protein